MLSKYLVGFVFEPCSFTHFGHSGTAMYIKDISHAHIDKRTQMGPLGALFIDSCTPYPTSGSPTWRNFLCERVVGVHSPSLMATACRGPVL